MLHNFEMLIPLVTFHPYLFLKQVQYLEIHLDELRNTQGRDF